MAELYRFFASGEGDEREYNQEHWAEVIKGLSGNGIITAVDDRLEVIADEPASMDVIVKTGAAWLEGYWYRNASPKAITLQDADSNQPRIDRIILRLDVYGERKIEAVRKTGTPASAPSPPGLEQTSDYWEFPLANISVGAGVTSITDANITDKREFVAQVRRIVLSTEDPEEAPGMEGDVWIKHEE